MSEHLQSDKLQRQEDAEMTGVHDAAEFASPGDIVGRHFEVISVLGGGGQKRRI